MANYSAFLVFCMLLGPHHLTIIEQAELQSDAWNDAASYNDAPRERYLGHARGIV